MTATRLAPPLTRAPNGRRVVLLIATLLALPFLAAALLWQSGWQPGRGINHGELLVSAGRPILQLSENQLQRVDDGNTDGLQKIAGNATLPSDRPVLGHWLLALAVPAECGTACVDQLQLGGQVQRSLNKNMARLRRALLGPRLDDPATLAALAGRWPGLVMARTDAAAWQTLGGARIAAPQLLVIDPQGRLVLRYSPAPDPRGLRRDLERLLKYSWLG